MCKQVTNSSLTQRAMNFVDERSIVLCTFYRKFSSILVCVIDCSQYVDIISTVVIIHFFLNV